MEQKDYLLREIEKIGLILKMILHKLAGTEENPVRTAESNLEEAKELLLQETGFDTALFLSLDESGTVGYIAKFRGLNSANIESLADILSVAAMIAEPGMIPVYLEKALNLYELCNSSDKTFSFDRERKISEINNKLKGKE
jgi:hypothetical protein